MSQVAYNNLPIISTAFQTQFKTEVYELLRQQGSLLRKTVTEQALTLGQMDWNQIGQAVGEWKDTRHADTTYQEIEHTKRRIITRDAFIALILDREDMWRSLSEFQGPYQKAIVDGLSAKIDDAIIGGILGVNYGGADGASPITLPSSQFIPVDYTTTGTTGPQPLSVGKLTFAAHLLNQAHVPMYEERICLMSSNQMFHFLQQEQVANSLYNVQRALYEGQANNFGGFKLILTERIPRDVNGNEQVIFFSKPRVLFGVRKDLSTRISELPTKHYALQVYGDLSIACSRQQESAVVVASCAV